MTKDERLHRGMGLANLSLVFGIVIGFLSALITSRLYGAEVLGRFALVSAPTILVIQFSSVSEQLGLVHELAGLPVRSPAAGGVFKATFRFSVALTVAAAVVVCCGSWFYFSASTSREDLFLPALVMVLGYVALDNVAWNLDAILTAYREFESQFVANLIQVLTMLAATVAMAAVGRGTWELVASSLIGSLVSTVVRFHFARRHVLLGSAADLDYGRSRVPVIVRFGVASIPATMSFALATQSTVWILGAVATQITLGGFSRALNLSGKLNEVPFKMAQVYYPTQVRNFHDDDRPAMVRAFADTLTLSFVPLLGVVAAVAGASTGVLRVFGDDFVGASGALGFLLASAMVFFVDVLIGSTLQAVRRPGGNSIGSVLGMVVTLSIVWPLSDTYGATGASAAVLLGQVASCAFKIVIVRRAVRVEAGRGLLKPAAVVAVGTAVSFATARVIDRSGDTIVHTGVAGIAAVALYFALVLVFRAPRLPMFDRFRRPVLAGGEAA